MFFGRGKKKDRVRRLEADLDALEQQAGEAAPGFDAPSYNRAGDRCLEAGQRERALAYYGEAIDAYLVASRYDAAAAVCRKLLRIAPEAVRARCTLAWLSIGKELVGDARRELDAYVEAARRAGQEALAARQLRMMAEATPDAALVHHMAELLRELGDDGGAGRLADAAERRGRWGAPTSATQYEERWARVLRAALMGPAEIEDVE